MDEVQTRMWLARLNYFLISDLLTMGGRARQESGGIAELMHDAVVGNAMHMADDPERQRALEEFDSQFLDGLMRQAGRSEEECERGREIHRQVVQLAREIHAAAGRSF